MILKNGHMPVFSECFHDRVTRNRERGCLFGDALQIRKKDLSSIRGTVDDEESHNADRKHNEA